MLPRNCDSYRTLWNLLPAYGGEGVAVPALHVGLHRSSVAGRSRFGRTVHENACAYGPKVSARPDGVLGERTLSRILLIQMGDDSTCDDA
jgi:hypothetical protein